MASSSEGGTADPGDVQDRLAEALDLCRRISSIASRTDLPSSPSSAGSGAAGTPRGTSSGIPLASPRPGVPRFSRTVSSTSTLSGSATDPIRMHKSLCGKVILRVQHLLPILERLDAEGPSVADDPRAPFVIFRLEEELRELLALLTDCSKGTSFSSLLSSKKRALADKLDACLQEIRQCYTECLILLGTNSSRRGSGGGYPSDGFRNPEDSIPSSPMVDRSPRTVEGLAGRVGAARRSFARSASDLERESLAGRRVPMVPQSVRPVTRPGLPDPFSCLNPSTPEHQLTSAAPEQWKSQPQPPLSQQGSSPSAVQMQGQGQVASIQGHGPQGQIQMQTEAQAQAQAQIQDDDANVRGLVALLSLGSSNEKHAALNSLLRISEASDSGKLKVAAAGAIPALSVMLALDNEQMKISAASVLLHLSWLDENRIVIAKAGCVPSLVKLLRSGNAQSRTLAARVLWNLAINMDNKVIIAAAEAIPSLVAIIQSDSEPAAKREAAEALVQLTANNPANQKAVAEAGAIPSLVGMLREGGPKEQDKAAFALGMLAVNNDENKLTISGSGATPLLLDLLQSPHVTSAKSASWTLYVLSSHSISAAYITASDGLQKVQAALHSGPAEAKYWAAYILSLLDPEYGPPEKNITHRYSSIPNSRIPEDTPRQRRDERQRMFAV